MNTEKEQLIHTERATEKQRSWIFDMVWRHPDFTKNYYQHCTTAEEEEQLVVEWLNAKYEDYMPDPILSLKDVDMETASALITHLRMGEDQRRYDKFKQVTKK